MLRLRGRSLVARLVVMTGALVAVAWPRPALTQAPPSIAELLAGYIAWLRDPAASRPALEIDLDVARSQLARLAPTFLVPLEGTIGNLRGRCPEVTFRLAGSTVSTSADTTFDEAVCGQLINGQRVRAFRQPNPGDPIARIVAPLSAEALRSQPAVDEGQRRILATFAIELATPGSLRQSAAAARLVEWACELVRTHAPVNDFDRAWQRAALSVLEGVINARALDAHVAHFALPDEPRLTLARAIVEEQSTAPAETLAGQAEITDALRVSYLIARTKVDHARASERAVALFRSAATNDALRPEAMLRLGHVQLGMNRYDDALASFAGIEQLTSDLALVYLTHLFRGLAYEGLGRATDAGASYRRALDVSPNSHSATMRQAALAFRHGRRDDANQMLDALLANDDPNRDPWWPYYAADWRFWYQRIDAVRAMLRAPGGGADARPARRPLSHRPPAGVEFVPARWQDQIFRSRADAVTIQVAVKSGNKPVAGLTAADFDLRDNGVPQEISSVSVEKVPLDLTLLLDLSSSVDGVTLQRLKAAVHDTAALLRPDDRLRLIAISQVLQEIVPLQPPSDAMPLERLMAQGATSLYDGLAAAMMRPTDPGRRQLVLAFSDGRDSTSIIDETTAKDIARLSDAVVDIVVPIGPDDLAQVLKPWTRQDTVPVVLPQLVAPTAGQVFTFMPGESISSVFKRMLDDFRAAYVLQYVPQGVTRGGWHDVAVTLKKPGKYEVRARNGYSGSLDRPASGASGRAGLAVELKHRS